MAFKKKFGLAWAVFAIRLLLQKFLSVLSLYSSLFIIFDCFYMTATTQFAFGPKGDNRLT